MNDFIRFQMILFQNTLFQTTIKKPKLKSFGFYSGSSTWARTRDPLINSQVLLPTELSRNRKMIIPKFIKLTSQFPSN